MVDGESRLLIWVSDDGTWGPIGDLTLVMATRAEVEGLDDMSDSEIADWAKGAGFPPVDAKRMATWSGERDRGGNPICGQDFMAGTICTAPPGHPGHHSAYCQTCGGDWAAGTCRCPAPPEEEEST